MENTTAISTADLVLVDWLTFTTTIWGVEDLIHHLGLSEINLWEECDCFRYGYRHRQSYGGISILTDGHQESMGVCIEFSGQGCRTFEDFSHLSWIQLFSFLMELVQRFHKKGK